MSAVYATRPGQGRWAPMLHRMLCGALSAAEVELGGYDHRLVLWLSQQEPETVAVIAGWVTRAAAVPPER